MSRRGYIGSAGAQLHYRESGDPSGPPLVWLHQTASSSAMWERVLTLVDPRYRCIALDTPGFGGSDPLPGDPSIPAYARRLGSAIEQLTSQPVVLIGHHTGAVIAPEVALAAPSAVRALVLIGCVVITSDDEELRVRATAKRWSIDARGDYVTEHVIPRLWRSVLRDDPEHMQSELVAYLQAGADYVRAYDAVYGYRAAERLPSIGVPTWCAVGASESADLLRWTALAAELIPGGRFTMLRDAGSEVAFEEPQIVAELVGRVLGELG